jgi:hypothetical protein
MGSQVVDRLYSDAFAERASTSLGASRSRKQLELTGRARATPYTEVVKHDERAQGLTRWAWKGFEEPSRIKYLASGKDVPAPPPGWTGRPATGRTRRDVGNTKPAYTLKKDKDMSKEKKRDFGGGVPSWSPYYRADNAKVVNYGKQASMEYGSFTTASHLIDLHKSMSRANMKIAAMIARQVNPNAPELGAEEGDII